MYKYVVNSRLIGCFLMPSDLEELIDLDTIPNKTYESLYKSLEEINKLVQVDDENDNMQVIEGGFSFQCISLSLKNIESLTKDNPKFFIETVRMFKLEQYLKLDEIMEEKRKEIKELETC